MKKSLIYSLCLSHVATLCLASNWSEKHFPKNPRRPSKVPTARSDSSLESQEDDTNTRGMKRKLAVLKETPGLTLRIFTRDEPQENTLYSSSDLSLSSDLSSSSEDGQQAQKSALYPSCSSLFSTQKDKSVATQGTKERPAIEEREPQPKLRIVIRDKTQKISSLKNNLLPQKDKPQTKSAQSQAPSRPSHSPQRSAKHAESKKLPIQLGGRNPIHLPQDSEFSPLDMWLKRSHAKIPRPRKTVRPIAKAKDRKIDFKPPNSREHSMVVGPFAKDASFPYSYTVHGTYYGIEIESDSITIATNLREGNLGQISGRNGCSKHTKIQNSKNIGATLEDGGLMVTFKDDTFVVWTAGPYYQVFVKRDDLPLKEVRLDEPNTMTDGKYTNLKPSKPFSVKEKDILLVIPIDTPKNLVEKCLRSEFETEEAILDCIIEERRLAFKRHANVVVSIVGDKDKKY